MKYLISFLAVHLTTSYIQAQGIVNYGPYEGSKSYVGEKVDGSGKLLGWGHSFRVSKIPAKLYCWIELTRPLGVTKAEISVFNQENEEIQFNEMKTDPAWVNFLVPVSFCEKGRFKISITTPFDEEDGGYSIATTYWVEIQ